MKKLVTLVALVCCIVSFAGRAQAAAKYISIGTGGVTGVYYALGGTIANLITKNIPEYTATAESTGAAVENVFLIHRKQIDIGFVDASSGYNAPRGQGSFEGEAIKDMRSVVSLYPEAVQVVTLDQNINTIADLKGKKVAVGSPGSGTEVMAKNLLAMYDLTYDDVKADYLGFGDASSGLKDRTIDAAFIWAGVPTAGIMELGAQNKVKLLNFTPDMIEKIKAVNPYCVPFKVTREHYTGMIADVETVAIPATLQCSADLPDEFVYQFLTVLFDNLPALAATHARGGDVSLESALSGLDVDNLHPGAVKFYKEKGVIK